MALRFRAGQACRCEVSTALPRHTEIKNGNYRTGRPPGRRTNVRQAAATALGRRCGSWPGRPSSRARRYGINASAGLRNGRERPHRATRCFHGRRDGAWHDARAAGRRTGLVNWRCGSDLRRDGRHAASNRLGDARGRRSVGDGHGVWLAQRLARDPTARPFAYCHVRHAGSSEGAR